MLVNYSMLREVALVRLDMVSLPVSRNSWILNTLALIALQTWWKILLPIRLGGNIYNLKLRTWIKSNNKQTQIFSVCPPNQKLLTPFRDPFQKSLNSSIVWPEKKRGQNQTTNPPELNYPKFLNSEPISIKPKKKSF